MRADKSASGIRRYAVYSTAAGAVVLAVVVLVLMRLTSLEQILDIKRSVAWESLALYLLLSLGMTLTRTLRYRMLLRANGQTAPWLPLLGVVLVRRWLVDMLPARLGEGVYIGLLKTRLRIDLAPGTASAALAFLLDVTALGPLLAIVALVTVTGTRAPPGLLLLGGLAVTAAGATAMVLLRPATAFARRALAGRHGRVAVALRGFAADLHRDLGILGSTRLLVRLFLLSLGVRAFKYGSMYVLLVGLLPVDMRATLGVARGFAGLCLAEMSSSIPFTHVLGFGIYEGVWTVVFAALGLPADLAAGTGIVHHLITSLVSGFLGATALALLILTRRRPHAVTR